jgi:alkylation response protein AidB-like acyl-CoA dehydrogenase
MDFSRSAEEESLFQQALQFAADNLNGDVTQRDHASQFPRDQWKECAEYGVLGWFMPTDLGGQGLSASTCAYLMEALGKGSWDNGLTFALGAQIWSVQKALLQFGTPEQIATYLPRMISGDLISAFAITEAGSGSDAFALAATARRAGDDFILNGEKCMITLAPVADVALVFCVTNPDAGRWGLSAFLVDTQTPGCTLSPNIPKMGLRTVPFGIITLTDCRIPASQMLGSEGTASSIFNTSQSWERSLVLAPQLGAMQRMIDACVAFAKGRKRAGLAIGKHQAVSHRIADMRIRLETSRLLLYKSAYLLDSGRQGVTEAAMAKTHISEAFVATCQDAIAVHGGAGYLTETQLERQARDALGATIYGGTVDIQRNIIAGMLGV